MVNLLVKDANSWDRDDDRFPFLRTFDAYAGHSWAAGHGDFAEGNNQESSSESMNFASRRRALGRGDRPGPTCATSASTSTPPRRPPSISTGSTWTTPSSPTATRTSPSGMVWGGKGVHSTWFGADPEFIHGINILPVTSGSLYLGRHPDYVAANYDEIVAERGGQPTIWKDVLWQYLALSDPAQALGLHSPTRTTSPSTASRAPTRCTGSTT